MSRILLVLIFIITGYCAYAEPERTSIAQVEKMFLQERYEKVISEAQVLIDSRSGSRDQLYYIKGLSHLKLNQFREAREDFEKIVSKFSKSNRAFDAYVAIGDSHFLEGNVDKALRAYQDVLNRYPNGKNIPAVYYKMGNCFKKMGSDDKREEYFNKVKRLAPSSFESKMIQGTILSEVPKIKVSDRFSVQVGSFKNKKNAENLAYKLSREGFDSFMEAPVSSSDRLYRVKVGKLESKEEAEILASRLRDRGYSTKICH